MYLIGDRVVHPMHGAGVIRDIVEERMAGQRKRTMCSASRWGSWF